jgi:phosphatidylglycerophosphate synthase
MKFFSIRKDIYKHNLSSDNGKFLNFSSPYTLIKSIYYIETASFFLFLTQKIIKSPNFITFLYVLTGITGSFLLNSTDITFFYVGLFLVFTKGTFDWADGPLARYLNKSSFFGHAFDIYGAHLNDAAFRISFVYFTFGYYPELLFLFPIIAFVLLITKLNLFSSFLFFENNKNKINNNFNNKINHTKNDKKIIKWYYRYISFLDSRARSIDFLLLILFFNKMEFYDFSEILLIFSVLIILREIIMHIASIFQTFKSYKNNKDG